MKSKNKTMFDQIVVIDIEATCWKERTPACQISEIIEIGICPIDIKSGNILETRDIIVKPEHSKVSNFCTKLTTLTQEQVDAGISFKDACMILITEFMTKKRVWASYGNYDKNKFVEQCHSENVVYPFSNDHINVKTMFGIMNSQHRQVGMTEALKILGIPLDGTHHRGNDDAFNIARILSCLLFKHQIDIRIKI